MKQIPLTQGKVALVDDELFDELNRFKWCAQRSKKTFYASRGIRLPNGKRTSVAMHREIFRMLGKSIPAMVDHRDRDGLNNQWSNLRSASQSEQSRNQGRRRTNKSGFIGVAWRTRDLKWMAYAQVSGKTFHLGTFTDSFSAAWVRDAFAKTHHGEFASLNDLVDRRKVIVTVSVDRRISGLLAA
jgi:hypothetical protein